MIRTLLLFTRDLRVHDHPALHEAARSGEVVPLFVLHRPMLDASANRARFLVQALADLDDSLRRRGSRLHVRTGEPAVEAAKLARTTGCDTLAVTADFSRTATRREHALEEACADPRIRFRPTPGHAIVEPGAVAPEGRDHYSVFTPYLRAWLGQRRRTPLPAPRTIRTPGGIDAGTLPGPPEGDSPDMPLGGETAGRKALSTFAAGPATHGGRA